MFMTQMSLDVNRPDTQHALSHPEVLQHAVEGMYQGLKIDTLWTTELLNHRTYLRWLSAIRPTPLEAHERFGYPGCFPSWETWDYDPQLERIYRGIRRSFRLTAAIMRDDTLPVADQLRSLAAVTTQQQSDWLTERQELLGCRIDQLLTEHSRVRFLPTSVPEQSLALLAVEYNGLLTVTDADRFREAMTQGVGCVTGYGFGLLTVDDPGNLYHIK